MNSKFGNKPSILSLGAGDKSGILSSFGLKFCDFFGRQGQHRMDLCWLCCRSSDTFVHVWLPHVDCDISFDAK